MPGQLPPGLLAGFDAEPAAAKPELLLRHLAHQYRVLAERASSVWQTYRDAAPSTPTWQPTYASSWSSVESTSTGPHVVPTDAWRGGLTIEKVVDTAWTIASPQTHELLVTTAGYSYDDLEAWVLDTLTAVLLSQKRSSTR